MIRKYKINTDEDAILVVDLQNDFIDGSLAVPDGNSIIPTINKYLERIPIQFFSRDAHPEDHCSFIKQGGPWPPHCVVGSEGYKIHKDINVGEDATMIDKGVKTDKDAYSAFEDTDLDKTIVDKGIKRLFICGLATDYCVKATTLDALIFGKENHVKILLSVDAIKAVNIDKDDGFNATTKMVVEGALPVIFEDLE